MRLRNTRRTALLGTALTLSMGGAAQAATEINLNPDVVSGLQQECRTLARTIDDRGNTVPDDRSDMVLNALNSDDAQACARATETLASAAPADQDRMKDETRDQAKATDTDRETDTARATERVEVSEEATIEGEAAVIVPKPQVDVEVDAPQVTVRKAQPDVTVNDPAPTIQVQQPQPNVSVEIPEIAVRVEVPAPKIFIQTDDPSVDIASADPKVEVRQGEPRVSVRQPDPELKVDLGVDENGEASTEDRQMADAEGRTDDNSEMNRGGEVDVASNEPKVEIVQPEGEPRVAVNSNDPQVEFQGSRPNVSVSFTQEPTVEIAQTGEPTVTFETAEERDARRTEDAKAADRARSEEPRQQAEAEGDAKAEGQTILVGDLLGMDVIGAEGEDLGEPEAMIERGGKLMLVIEEGGFLGLGENAVAVPMERVAFNLEEEELHLQQLTEDEIESARDVEYDVSEEVEMDREIRVN